jgi:hypothetical protein
VKEEVEEKLPMKRPERIAIDYVGAACISTVKLNDFHSVDNIYETCIFYEDGTSDVVAQYTSEDQARQGHADAVRKEETNLRISSLGNSI